MAAVWVAAVVLGAVCAAGGVAVVTGKVIAAGDRPEPSPVPDTAAALAASEGARRPEVLALLRRARELRTQADECEVGAVFWAGLDDHGHPAGEACDDERCLQGRRMYPEGA